MVRLPSSPQVPASARTRGYGVLTTVGVEPEAPLPFAGPAAAAGAGTGRRTASSPAESAADGLRRGGRRRTGNFHRGSRRTQSACRHQRRRPAALVAEDVHWLDAPTAEMHAFVGRRLESDRIFLLAAMRAGFESPLVAARLPELVTEPLSAAAAARLLDAYAADLTTSGAQPHTARRSGKPAGPRRAAAGVATGRWLPTEAPDCSFGGYRR